MLCKISKLLIGIVEQKNQFELCAYITINHKKHKNAWVGGERFNLDWN